jgi:hypothetical protein
MTDPDDPLPTTLTVTSSFNQRLPSQRFLDLLARIEPAPFPDIAQSQPFRLIAFRALLRDYPDRDATSLWLHAYDCEVDVVDDVDGPLGNGRTPSPPSAATGAAFPTISTT